MRATIAASRWAMFLIAAAVMTAPAATAAGHGSTIDPTDPPEAPGPFEVIDFANCVVRAGSWMVHMLITGEQDPLDRPDEPYCADTWGGHAGTSAPESPKEASGVDTAMDAPGLPAPLIDPVHIPMPAVPPAPGDMQHRLVAR